MLAMSTSLNAQELESAQQRWRRVNFWFCFFIVLIPLGVIAPCLVSMVAYQIAGDKLSAPIALSALLWPLVGVAGALLLRGDRQRARRTLALVRLADSFGLTFTYKPAPEKFEFLSTVAVMANPHSKSAENLLEGQSGRFRLLALDYHYAYLLGNVNLLADQTIVVFPEGFAHLPDLAVFPISIMGKLENFLLGKAEAIAFPQFPQFNSQFAVIGRDPQRITACLTPDLQNLLLSDRLLSLVVDQGRLLVFRRLTIIKAEDYQAFLARAYQVAELLSQ